MTSLEIYIDSFGLIYIDINNTQTYYLYLSVKYIQGIIQSFMHYLKKRRITYFDLSGFRPKTHS